MIPKKAPRGGTDTNKLLEYLYGPGKRDEHVDPHMVAAWNPYVEDPAAYGSSMSIADLAMLLDAPVHALRGKKPRKHVYHVAVRNAPSDRLLTDEEWAQVAAEMMHAAGIAEHGDDQGARWVAIRHAEDHIHIVATLARQDGRQPNIRRDMVKMQAAARRFEVQFGLRRLVSGDKTAKVWPKTGEKEKAARRSLPQTPRQTLQRIVREAAAAASGDADFFARIGDTGVRVRLRIAPDGRTTGYSVALPGDRDRSRTAVWFPGGRLAPDLSLPRVRERWAQPGGEPPAASPQEAWRIAADKVRAAADVLGAGGLHQGAGDVAALGDLIATAAAAAPVPVRAQIRAAAGEFERAARAPGARRLEGEARRLYRSSSRTLTAASLAVGRNDTAAMLGFLLALVEAVESSRRWHQAQQHRAQAGRRERGATAARGGRGHHGGAGARGPPARPPRTGPTPGAPLPAPYRFARCDRAPPGREPVDDPCRPGGTARARERDPRGPGLAGAAHPADRGRGQRPRPGRGTGGGGGPAGAGNRGLGGRGPHLAPGRVDEK